MSNDLTSLILVMLLAAGSQVSGKFDPQPAKAPAERVAIEVTDYPPFPANLKNEGYSHGRVRYLVSLNDEGRLLDALVVEATHVDFALAVDRLIGKWKFTPPRVEGEPVPVVFPLNIYFRSGQSVRTIIPGVDPPERLFRPQGSERYRAYEMTELDRVPGILRKIPPTLPSSLAGHSFQNLEVKFSFYIDPFGNVRIPILESVNQDVDELLLTNLQEALRLWKFEAPLVNDRPVLAKAVQPFHFDGRVPGIESFELDE